MGKIFIFTLFFIAIRAQDGPLNYYALTTPATEIAGIISEDLSGVTWNKENNYLYMIEDDYGTIWETDTNCNILRTISGGTFGDTEDIAFLGHDEFAVVTEEGDLYIGNIPHSEDDMVIDPDDFQKITFAYPDGNDGPEGVTYDPLTETFYIVKEKNPQAFYRFQRPGTSADTVITPDIPFDAESIFDGIMEDLSALTFDKRTGRILILSEDSHRIIDVDPETGTIHGVLDMSDASQHEGISFYNNNYDLIITSEPNYYTTYSSACYADDLHGFENTVCLEQTILGIEQDCNWDFDFNYKINVIDLLIANDILNGYDHYDCSD